MSRTIPLSPHRRAVVAMLEYAKNIPTIPVARRMDLGALLSVRRQQTQAPSWSAIFLRAYALTCVKFPALRRCWLSWPYRRLYEAPHTACAVAVEREWEGEPVVFYGRVRQPELTPLAEIQERLRLFQTLDVNSFQAFRNTLRFGKMPRFLQRLALKLKLDISGPRHVKHVGTFGLTNYGMHGAESLHPIWTQGTVLTLGPMTTQGEITVKIVYDHRIFDGAFIARCLNHLEEVLLTTMRAELTESPRLAA
jgi:pyruvate/2-oxoglutarate dehydrogenase complex dihydrolipoamide acyltransferase (E2) component